MRYVVQWQWTRQLGKLQAKDGIDNIHYVIYDMKCIKTKPIATIIIRFQRGS